jgi:hypothetical protein
LLAGSVDRQLLLLLLLKHFLLGCRYGFEIIPAENFPCEQPVLGLGLLLLLLLLLLGRGVGQGGVRRGLSHCS